MKTERHKKPDAKDRGRPTVRGETVRLSPRDNVVTALRDLRAGDAVRVGAGQPTVPALEAIAFGHKMAVSRIRVGGAVIKYGECIGAASRAIAAGAHVHVHNVVSRRARA